MEASKKKDLKRLTSPVDEFDNVVGEVRKENF